MPTTQTASEPVPADRHTGSPGEEIALPIERLGRVGLEIELLAPPGADRDRLATAIVDAGGGHWRRFFEHCTESSSDRPDHRNWHHLSRAVEVFGSDRAPLCRIVDDTTIKAGLSTAISTRDYRIVGDDKRIVFLIRRLASPTAEIDDVLDPVAAVFGGAIEPHPQRRRYRLIDESGLYLATALFQRADRERVCEIVTPVISSDLGARLDALLAPARSLGCVVPAEAAVHVHFDAGVFRDAGRFHRLVELFTARRDELRQLFDTNPRCRQLGPLNDDLVTLVGSPGFDDRPWPEVDRALRPIQLSKYCDVNLRNLKDRTRGKDTVEVRILAGSIDTEAIAAQVDRLQQLLGSLA
jgi:hypothetical protein